MSDHPMFTLFGEVVNVYVQPGGTSKKTGEVFDPRDKVQIMGQVPLQGGGTKLDLVTLNVEDARLFQSSLKRNVRVPVGVYALGKSVGFFIPQGAKPLFSNPVPQ